MTRTIRDGIKGALSCAVIFGTAICSYAQQSTLINLGTQGRNIDFTNASATRPVKTGTALPGTCTTGDMFLNTAAPVGQNLFACTAPNTWAPQGAGNGNWLSDPGANGIVVRTAANTTSAVAAPAGTIVGTTDAQTLTNKSINASEINTGTLVGSVMPAFSGDVSTSAGSTTTSLATVNSSPGTFGDSSHALQLTVDGKGRITSVTAVALNAGGNGGISALTGDVTASGSGSVVATLAASGVTAGTYGDSSHVPQITFDAKGRATAVSSIAISSTGGGITQLTGDGTTPTGGGSQPLTLTTVNSGPGQCGDATHVCQVTTDGKGRVTSQAPVAISAGGTGTVTHTAGALTAGRLIIGNGNGDITVGNLTGDITTAGGTATTLATVNSNTGACGDSTHVCQVTLDAKGRATAATPVAISGGGGGGGASLATQLLDFAPVISSGAVTFGGSCSSATPCFVYLNGARYPFTNTSTAAVASGTNSDQLWFYVDATGARNIGYNSANTYTITGANSVASISAFPASTYPLFMCTVTSGAIASCADYRQILAAQALTSGLGASVTQSSGVQQVNISELVDAIADANYTVPGTACGHFEVSPVSTARTWGLPTPSTGGMMLNGCVIAFKANGAGSIVLTPTGATINGNASYTIASGHVCRVVSDGTNYQTEVCP